MKQSTEKKRHFKLPSTFILLLAIMIILGLGTYLIPTGSFDRVLDPETGREIVVPGSYHTVESEHLSVFDILTAFPTGLGEAASMITLVLIVGGSIHIIESTGAISAAIGALAGKKDRKRSYVVIFLIMLLTGTLGYAYGAAESLLPFIPIVFVACRTMGYDSITAVAAVMVAGTAGFAGSAINPGTVGLAQTIAGLPLTSGFGFRTVAFAAFLLSAVLYTFLYMRKLAKDPQASCMYEIDQAAVVSVDDGIPEFNARRKAVAFTFLAGIILMVYCITTFSFSLYQVSTYYFILAVVCGAVGGMSIKSMEENFFIGAKNMVSCAILVGLAKSISVVMNQGNVLDTIIYAASTVIQSLPASLKAIGMFIVQDVLNILIPSGSGQAAATMPIMVPLADLVGMTRQTAVLAFQFGDALTNMITPTAGWLMGGLAMCNIKWEKWVKWFLPLYLFWMLLACIFLAVATAINFGPF